MSDGLDGRLHATVFDIERYATEDGPGIRSVVFFKGCNLRCSWCQNPESHASKPQVLYVRSNCTACGKCLAACPAGAISDRVPFGFITDHSRCTLCGACADVCFANARRIVGRRMTADQIIGELVKDRTYYEESGGGVTFSGGEPLLQAEMVEALAHRCKDLGIHVAVETAANVSWSVLRRLAGLVDLLYVDFKHHDSERHRAATGIPNTLILDNLRRISDLFGNVVVRIPVIRGVNADPETMGMMFAFLAGETDLRNVELLPFHKLGVGKYEGLGLRYGFENESNMDRAACEPFARLGREHGLSVRVGAEGT